MCAKHLTLPPDHLRHTRCNLPRASCRPPTTPTAAGVAGSRRTKCSHPVLLLLLLLLTRRSPPGATATCAPPCSYYSYCCRRGDQLRSNAVVLRSCSWCFYVLLTWRTLSHLRRRILLLLLPSCSHIHNLHDTLAPTSPNIAAWHLPTSSSAPPPTPTPPPTPRHSVVPYTIPNALPDNLYASTY